MSMPEGKETRVEASLNLSKYSGQLLEGQPCFAHNPLEVKFNTLDCGLPQASKVRCSLRNEIPSNALGGAEIWDVSCCSLLL